MTRQCGSASDRTARIFGVFKLQLRYVFNGTQIVCFNLRIAPRAIQACICKETLSTLVIGATAATGYRLPRIEGLAVQIDSPQVRR
jgi:hypothetical protein